jgi:hypothetical protein
MEYREGQTATNKQTGEKFVFQGGEWKSLLNRSRETGASLPAIARGAITFAQGPTLEFADELAGAVALGQLGQSYAMGGTDTPPTRADYTAPRDLVRGATQSFAEQYPVGSTALKMFGGALLGGFGPVRTAAMTVPQRLGQALATSAGTGGVAGAGESEAETLGDVGLDALKSAGTSAVFGTGAQGVGMGISAGVRRGAAPFRQRSAEDLARERLAQVLLREMPEKMQMQNEPFQSFAQRKLERLGEGAPLAAIGPQTVGQIDLLASMPGTAAKQLDMTRRRIASERGPVIETAAERLLDAQGMPFRATLSGFAQAKQDAAQPFYDQLRGTSFVADRGLVSLLKRAAGAQGPARELAQVSGADMPDLSKINPGDPIPFEALDRIKRALFDIEEGARGEFGKATERSRAYSGLRNELIRKLDDLSPKDDSGNSIYRTARDTFAGGAEIETAMRRGSESLRLGVEDLSELVNGMSRGEMDAFRLGAAQALRDKIGTQSGQTQLLNAWKEPALQGRLRLIFGDNFNNFRRVLLGQERVKSVERAGQGSQTFARQEAQRDLNNFMETVDVAQNVQTGNVPGIVRYGAQRLQMPEASRNALARMLLLRGSAAQQEIAATQAYRDALARRRSRAASGTGSATGAGGFGSSSSNQE